MCVFGSLVEKKRRREKKCHQRSLFCALCDDKKKKERGKREEKDDDDDQSSSRAPRLFDGFSGDTASFMFLECFCEDKWKEFFWSTVKSPKRCPPPPVSSSLSKTKRSTDSRPKTATRESKVLTYREVLDEYFLKKREKNKIKGTQNSRILRDFFYWSKVVEDAQKHRTKRST